MTSFSSAIKPLTMQGKYIYMLIFAGRCFVFFEYFVYIFVHIYYDVCLYSLEYISACCYAYVMVIWLHIKKIPNKRVLLAREWEIESITGQDVWSGFLIPEVNFKPWRVSVDKGHPKVTQSHLHMIDYILYIKKVCTWLSHSYSAN